MIPHQGRAIDTVNFRNVKESQSSVDMGAGALGGQEKPLVLSTKAITQIKGVPLDSGLATPAAEIADPFEEFNSVTLHHDGDEDQR